MGQTRQDPSSFFIRAELRAPSARSSGAHDRLSTLPGTRGHPVLIVDLYDSQIHCDCFLSATGRCGQVDDLNLEAKETADGGAMGDGRSQAFWG